MKIRYFACLGGLLSLCACSGGGGDGTLVDLATPIVATTTANKIPAAIVPLANTATPFNVATANMSFDTTVSGASQSFITAESGANTVTLTVDGTGTLTNVTSNINDAGAPGISFTRSGAPTLFSTFTLGQLATALESVGAGGVGSFALVGSNLNFSFFGGWIERTGATAFNTGSFAGGVDTPGGSVPTTGAASYSGTTFGTGVAATNPFTFTGTTGIVANFATGTVTTSFSNLITQSLLNNAVGRLPNLNGTSTITAGTNAYAGTLAGGSLTGTLNGNFFGGAAQETAGVYRVTDGATITVQGAFGAKQ